MPKMKTDSGAKKRFRVTGTGKLRREQSMKQHLMEHKSAKRKRRLGNVVDVSTGDEKRVKRLLRLR